MVFQKIKKGDKVLVVSKKDPKTRYKGIYQGIEQRKDGENNGRKKSFVVVTDVYENRRYRYKKSRTWSKANISKWYFYKLRYLFKKID